MARKKVTAPKIEEQEEKIESSLPETPVKEEETPEKLVPKDEEKVEEVKEVAEVDYLQKFQYGRELPLGDIRTNPREGKSALMKRELLKQPKVSVMIPVESGSDPKVRLSVTLNGYRLDLPRNTYIEVPKQIAEVVMNSQKQQFDALQQFRSDRNKDGLKEALS